MGPLIGTVLIAVAVSSILAWWHFLTSSRNAQNHYSMIIIVIGVAYALSLGFGAASRRRVNSIQTVGAALLAANIILLFFSTTYFVIGNTANFSQHLTRLDAFYVALGNLTTAGSGNIYPTTDKARGFVTIQYGADIILLTGLISFILLRLSRHD